MTNDLKHGKINLSAFSQACTIERNGQRGVFIPIEPNFLTEARNGCVYVDLVHFKTDKLAPYSHNTVISTPKEYRNKRNWVVGGVRLE